MEGKVFIRMKDHSPERTVVAHTADTVSEALVIRGLLESAGIRSFGSVTADPFPVNEPPEGTHGTEILVSESQVAEARLVIAEYVKSNAGAGDASEE
jgi:hypothetical protein